jgi:thiamine-monophosphate kinase
MNREGQLVERVGRAVRSRAFKGASHGLSLGIGDDAAIISPDGRSDWVISCDASLDGVHFLAKSYPPDSIGYKSLVRAASDLAAMGATPRFFLLTLAIPARLTGPWLDAFLRGMARAARSMRMVLIGGDTTKSATVSVSITVFGEVARGRALKRSTTRVGDIIYVSGKLGRAELGLLLMLRGGGGGGKRFRALLQHHLYPKIRLALGSWLATSRVASSMMDISDGLSTDVARLCAARRVGARLYAGRIPRVVIPDRVSKLFSSPKLRPIELALHGGEDYELLFTVPPRDVAKLRRAPGFSALSPIGEITRGNKVVLVDDADRETPLKPRGWDPFGKKQR